MKITKEKFVDLLTNSGSIFCGATHGLLSKDETYCLISGWFHEQFIDTRTCKRHPDGLVFCNGSVVSLHMESVYNQYDYPEGTVLTRTFQQGNTHYYIIRKAD